MEIVVVSPALKCSFWTKLETRIKIIAIFTLIVVGASLKHIPALIAGILLMLGMLILAGIPAKTYFKRILMVLPFAGFMMIFMPFVTPGQEVHTFHIFSADLTATSEGLDKAYIFSLRVLLSVLSLSFLTLTTELTRLFNGFIALRVPAILVNLIAFTIRYFTVLSEELQRMRIARKARGFTSGTHLFDFHTMRTLAELIGVLFIRAYERGERVFNAMLSRGYTGEVDWGSCRRPGLGDWLWGVVTVVFAITLKLIDLGWIH